MIVKGTYVKDCARSSSVCKSSMLNFSQDHLCLNIRLSVLRLDIARLLHMHRSSMPSRSRVIVEIMTFQRNRKTCLRRKTAPRLRNTMPFRE